MLEHVTANQTRFVAPGLSPDARGVALGRQVVALLPAVDRVVGLLRGLSERGSLDDVLAGLKIYQVRTPLQSREFIVQLPVTTSHAADGLAAITALLGGLTFTGSSKHFVRYRDSRSPLGYDVDGLHAEAGDFILYDRDFVQAYQREREVPFDRVALGLALEVERDDRLQEGETILLRVVPGLWRAVLGYLHRQGCPVEVAACETVGEEGRFYLIRATLLPRMEGLFRRTPGLELYRLKGPRVAVQLGYRHPLELGACGSIFAEDRLYLFSGGRQRLDLIDREPAFVSARALVALGTAARPLEQGAATGSAAERFGVPLRLVPSMGGRRPVVASCVPLDQAAWLKKLVYLLPSQVLERYQVCLTDEGIFLHGPGELEAIPLGEMYYEVAPTVLVQVGFELQPRVHPGVLLQHLGEDPDRLFYFGADRGTPFFLSRAAFQPLGREAVAAILVHPPGALEAPRQLPGPAALVNEAVGLFPLWGFSDAAPEKE